MKWISTDIEMYMKAKEYVDTVVVPLVPISLQGEISTICEMGEFITILSAELEREYKGRMVLLPAFTYLKNEETTALIERINLWNRTLVDSGVKHVILLTSDPDWKLNEKDVQATLLWVPSISFHDVDKKYIEQMLKSQLKPIQTIVMNLWMKEE
ncbi:MAG TPA: DUF2487 family protein [Bacillus bacterium]|nr:DUF2487 family protein [Bacillus sp. (in: firmicutes)]